MLNWLKSIFVKSLKAVAIYEVKAEGDKLQEVLRSRLAREGVGAVDRTIDAAQVRIIAAVNTRGPKWAFLEPIRRQVAEAVQAFGDELQGGIKHHVKEHGPAAVDRVFDVAQATLIKKIEAIVL